MIYDGNNNIDAIQAQKKLDYLIEKGKRFELTQKRGNRTLNQNSYLHLILTWFGLETGYTLNESKAMFKELNITVFNYLKNGREFVRSSSDLDTAEMTICIERFRNYSVSEAGVYLPDANEKQFLRYIEKEESRYENKIY